MPIRLDLAICTLGSPIPGEDPARVALGGSETAVSSMAQALARRGHRVRLFCNAPGSGGDPGIERFAAEELRGQLDAESCDLLLSSRFHDLIDQRLAARMFGLWHHDMPEPDFAARYANPLSKAAFSLFVSRFQADEYEKVAPGIWRLGTCTTNGIDFDVLEEATSQAGVPPQQPTFIYASRPERGLQALLTEVWPRVLARCPDARLLVSTYDLGGLDVGPAMRDLYAHLRQLMTSTPGVTELGSLPRVEFWRQLARCTAVLYPTAFPEVSCMVALEAQAAGIPIVTTDAFALGETVGTPETLVRAAWGSPRYFERFAELAQQLADDSAFRASVIARGRRHVRRESHSWDALAECWTDEFQRRFSERFEQNRAGVLSALLRQGETDAAARLSRSVDDPQSTFHAADLAQLPEPDAREAVAPPSTHERVFRIAPRPKVVATLLVRDEEANVRRCIESFAGLADEIIVGDTGSKDLTVDILRSMGFQDAETAGTSTRRLRHIDFEDFAQARNELASVAEGDYVFWQDADEILLGADRLREWVDDNVFFDALAIEQRNATFDEPVESSHPVRCFRPQTGDGPLQWVGCIHEFVEHGVNRPPQRVHVFPDAYVGHFGYHSEPIRRRKVMERNRALLRRDRERNPTRRMGLILGMREYFSLAREDLAENGSLSAEGYLALNLAYEIWQEHVRRFPARYQKLGFDISQAILRLFAEQQLPLRATGQLPIEVSYAFAARRGALEENAPSYRMLYASVAELRQEFEARLDALDRQLGPGSPRSVESLQAREGAPLQAALPPELFTVPAAASTPATSADLVRPIVTLTTIPGRLGRLEATLDSLLNQSLPPEKIVLALPLHCKDREGRLGQTEYPELPGILDDPRIEVLRCEEDYGSLTKLVPALRALQAAGDGDRSLITVDDDALYSSHLLRDLVEAGERYPDHVIATEGERIERPHSMRYNAPFGELEEETEVDIVQGCGGVLYRPRFFGGDFADIDLLEAIPESMGEDDHWISGHLAMRGVHKLHLAGSSYYQVIADTQQESLSRSNAWRRREAVVRYYQQQGVWTDHWRLPVSDRPLESPATPWAPRDRIADSNSVERLNVYGFGYGTSGWAAHTRGLARALGERFDVGVVSWNRPTATESHLPRPRLKNDAAIGVGPMTRMPEMTGRRRFGVAAWETTRLPSSHLEALKALDEVWAPSTWGRDLLVENGLAPERVHVVPAGVDAERYRPGSGKAEKGPVRFLCVGTWQVRKGVEELVRAFAQAFHPDDDVELVLHCHEDQLGAAGIEGAVDRLGLPPHPPIRGSQPCSEGALIDLYNHCNVFVLPTRGEGWGLPLLEAMACGLPVITTAYSAPLDYVTADNGYLIEVAELVPAKDNRHYTAHEDLGLWALPRGDHLEALLRRAAADERERRRKGEQARRDVLRRWTWQHAADAAAERLAQVFDIPHTKRVQVERDKAARRRADPPDADAPRNNHGAYSVRARYRRVVAGEPEGKRLVAVADERAEPFTFGSGRGDLCADVIFADVVDAAGRRFWAKKWLGAAAHRTVPTLQIERALARLGREDLVLARHEHPEHGLLYAFEEELFNSREVVHYCDRQLYFTEKECRHIEAFCDLTLEVEGLPSAPLHTLTDLQIARVGGRILFLDFEPRAAFVQEPGEAAAARRGQGI